MKRDVGAWTSVVSLLGALSALPLRLGLEPGRSSLVAEGSTRCFDTPNQPRGKGSVEVLIELTEPPLASRDTTKPIAGNEPADAAAAGRAAAARSRRIQRQQERVVNVLRRPPFGAVEIYRVRRALNAVAVRVDPARLAEIRKLADVKSVRPLVDERPHPGDGPPDS